MSPGSDYQDVNYLSEENLASKLQNEQVLWNVLYGFVIS